MLTFEFWGAPCEGVNNAGKNLFFTGAGSVAYFTAGVGIVYQMAPSHMQHFFLGHNDDITSMTLLRVS